MCGRFELKAKARDLARFCPGFRLGGIGLPGQDEMRPGDRVLMLSGEGDASAARLARWGLVGSFLDRAPQQPLIELPGEGLASMPFYGKILRRNRCLIPATAFFDSLPLAGRAAQEMRISDAQGEFLMFAGIFDEHPLAGTTCAILTTAANASLGSAYRRVPAILDRQAAAFWLTEPPEFPEAELAMLLQDSSCHALLAEAVPVPEESPQLAFAFA